MPARRRDGGSIQPETTTTPRGGLTVRDEFAIAVIGSLTYDLEALKADGTRFDAAAVAAYRMADAMLRVRQLPQLPPAERAQ